MNKSHKVENNSKNISFIWVVASSALVKGCSKSIILGHLFHGESCCHNNHVISNYKINVTSLIQVVVFSNKYSM